MPSTALWTNVENAEFPMAGPELKVTIDTVPATEVIAEVGALLEREPALAEILACGDAFFIRPVRTAPGELVLTVLPHQELRDAIDRVRGRP